MTQPERLPVADLEQIDRHCAEFEMAWQSGKAPEIGPILQQVDKPQIRSSLFSELLALDLDYRRRDGQSPRAEDYEAAFPEDAETIQRVFIESEKTQATPSFELPKTEHLAELFPSLEFIELIGCGGMGAVYKCRQKGLDRHVAIKILPEEFGHDVKSALRFTREARALAKLNHPNIVGLFEFGEVNGTFYFLMEYVNGPTLRQVLEAQELSPEKALALVPTLCDALQYAHDQGVVHRDIKPENILLDRSGQVKIADFGLSRILDTQETTHLTGTQQVMGTYRYMAPEQLEGARGVDHRADIYSLGVVFYEMLTGELPIGRFEVPSQKVHVDVRLDEVVLRTLEKEPRKRYQHASDVKCDVERITSQDFDLQNSSAHSKTLAPPHEMDALEKHERAANQLLLRRRLMLPVQSALRPLFWGQILQMVFGVGSIFLGVRCWSQNLDNWTGLLSGITLHLYGVALIICAGVVCTRIKRIDYSQPIEQIVTQVNRVRDFYLRAGCFLGFAWWFLWIPVVVAAGVTLDSYTLGISLTIGLVGFIACLPLIQRLLNPNSDRSQKIHDILCGESLRSAYQSLSELRQADIA